MLTIQETLEILKISRQTLYVWLKEKKIKSSRQINNRILIDKESLNKFIEERLNRE